MRRSEQSSPPPCDARRVELFLSEQLGRDDEAAFERQDVSQRFLQELGPACCGGESLFGIFRKQRSRLARSGRRHLAP